jgi:hypothetical protein
MTRGKCGMRATCYHNLPNWINRLARKSLEQPHPLAYIAQSYICNGTVNMGIVDSVKEVPDAPQLDCEKVWHVAYFRHALCNTGCVLRGGRRGGAITRQAIMEQVSF